MARIRLFISSVQREFKAERAALRDFLRGDALMRRFFDVFLFEDVPAADRRADELYLDEVLHCHVYVGLFGNEYGFEDTEGISPTEREFDAATEAGKYRLIYVRGSDDSARRPKMRALINRAQGELVRKRFATPSELVAGLYSALVEYLEHHEFIRSGPFDSTVNAKATPEDLDKERIRIFLQRARKARGFPLPEEATAHEVLTHLNLLDNERPTHAALLLFGWAAAAAVSYFVRGEVRPLPWC